MKNVGLMFMAVFLASSVGVSFSLSKSDAALKTLFCEGLEVIGVHKYCPESLVQVVVVSDDQEVMQLLATTSPHVSIDDRFASQTVAYPLAVSSAEQVQDVIPTQVDGVTEAVLDQRIAEVLVYVNSVLPTKQSLAGSGNAQAYVTKDYTVKSMDRVYENTDRSFEQLTDGGEFTSAALIDPTVSGSMYFAEVLPPVVTNRLYNYAGELYWNGSVLTSSTTGNWSGTSGDVFRLTGKVGIGTSAPTETLTVAGTLSAGTTTARIVDTGGAVCNVEAYGAVGDNATDNYTAIMAAIDACPAGGVVFFPMGQYRISQTIVLDRPVTLRGSFAPRWTYSSSPRSSIRAAFGSFVGDSIIHVRDMTISGESQHNNGGRIENITIDGGSYGTDVTGIYFEGLVRDWKLTDVDITQTTGNGFEAAVGAGSGNPRGFTIRGLSIYSADGHGFRATALNDSYIEDLLAVGNALRGIYISSMGETKINNSRAVFNALEGLYIDGSSSNGGLMFTDFSTDRNDRHGVRISLTGTTSVTFNGLLTRRDGANNGGGSETPYAGVAIIGSSSGNKVAPVFINGLTQLIGVDDSGNPPLAPSAGVRVANASYVKIDGQLWGVDDAYLDGGGNDRFIIEEDSVIKVGNDGVTEAVPTLYNRKWSVEDASAGLLFDGKVNIGSTTGSRLLNITAPAQSGARFIDTTNNVTFDMRAEDFQAFFGTFSNHQLRFQTNNTSRLTIDTNGYVGIGTTAPDQMLDVIGTIQASNLLGGATTLSTDANGNIIRTPSDARLKTNVATVDHALDLVLQLRGVTYDWRDSERFGSQREMGFIAQEVDEVVPEVIRKGGEYWSLNTPNLLAVVVEAIKEMWQTIAGNRARIELLEARVTELEAAVGVSTIESSVQNQDEDTNDDHEIATSSGPYVEPNRATSSADYVDNTTQAETVDRQYSSEASEAGIDGLDEVVADEEINMPQESSVTDSEESTTQIKNSTATST